jgi:hypothetical protein
MKTTLLEAQQENKDLISKDFAKSCSSILDSISEVNSEDVIYYKNCKLCNSDLRFDAEQRWDKSHKNSRSVWRWLTEEKNLQLTTAEVNHHMREHYEKQEAELRLKDYSSKINTFMQQKHKKINIVETCIAICQETVTRLAVMETKGDLRNEKIRADSLAKVMQQMSVMIELEGKLSGDVDPTEAITERFTTVWSEQMKKAPPEVRTHMIKILELIQMDKS